MGAGRGRERRWDEVEGFFITQQTNPAACSGRTSCGGFTGEDEPSRNLIHTFDSRSVELDQDVLASVLDNLVKVVVVQRDDIRWRHLDATYIAAGICRVLSQLQSTNQDALTVGAGLAVDKLDKVFGRAAA